MAFQDVFLPPQLDAGQDQTDLIQPLTPADPWQMAQARGAAPGSPNPPPPYSPPRIDPTLEMERMLRRGLNERDARRLKQQRELSAQPIASAQQPAQADDLSKYFTTDEPQSSGTRDDLSKYFEPPEPAPAQTPPPAQAPAAPSKAVPVSTAQPDITQPKPGAFERFIPPGGLGPDVATYAPQAVPFDPEGPGYDYESAKRAGLGPDQTGHWPSRDPATGLILKGRNHPTFKLTEQGETDAGHEIKKTDGRYYSQPRQPDLTAQPVDPTDVLQPPNSTRPRPTGGPALNWALGSETGMLTGDEAYREQQARIALSEQNLAEARAAVPLAHEEYGRLMSEAGPQAATFKREFRRRAGVEQAEQRLKAAEKEVTAARQSLPAQTALRDTAERVVQSTAGGLTGIVDNLRGLAEMAMTPGPEEDPELAKRMRQAMASIKKSSDELHEWGQELASPDPSQSDTFRARMAEGATSMALFMAGGLATRALGIGAGLGAGGLGALQQGGQGLREIENKIRSVEQRYAASGDLKDKAELDRLAQSKYIVMFASMGLGATEALPIERFFNRLNQVTAGRFSARLWHALKTSGAQTMEETLQEIGQNIGTDVVAKVFYDEGREIFGDKLTQSAEVAAVLGALMGGGAGMMTRRGRPAPMPGAPPTRSVEELEREAFPGAPPPGAAPPLAGGPTPTPASPAGGGPPAAPGTPSPLDTISPQAAFDLLARKGYSPDDIASMDAARIRGELETMLRAGEQPPAAKPGTRDAPVDVADLRQADGTINQDPTPGQRGAENYQHAHATVPELGLTGDRSISIETIAGGTRKSKDLDAAGQPIWQNVMTADYGRIKNTVGADGQPLDIFLGKAPAGGEVYVIDQIDPKTGKFDESKIMARFASPMAAVQAYAGSYGDASDWSRIGGMRRLSADEFQTWIKSGRTSQALSDQMRERQKQAKAQPPSVAPVGGPAAPVPQPPPIAQPVAPPPAAPTSQTGLTELGGDMGKGIVQGLHDMLWAKVEAGDTKESGRESAILQAAKMIRQRGGLQSREQWQPFADDYARIKYNPQTYQQDMQALVDRHIQPAAAAVIDQEAVRRLPDRLLSPAFIRAFEAQFEGEKRVPGIAISLSNSESEAISKAGLRGEDGLLNYSGLQILKAEAVRRIDSQEPAPIEQTAEQAAAEGDAELRKMFGVDEVATAQAEVESAIASVGEDPAEMDPADIKAAANLVLRGGMSPEDAFIAAMLKYGIDNNLLPLDQVKEAIGDAQTETLLQPDVGGERQPSAETAGPTVGGPVAAVEGERLPDGGETRGEEGRPEGGKTAESTDDLSQYGEPADVSTAGPAVPEPAASGEAREPTGRPTPGGKQPAGPAETTEPQAPEPVGGPAEPVGEAPKGELTEPETTAGPLPKPPSKTAADLADDIQREREEGDDEGPANKFEDAGEHIGGSRKDQWSGGGLTQTDIDEMNDAEQKSIEDGETPPAGQNSMVLADRFAAHLATDGFPTIVQARKFAKDAGFDLTEKQVEEALELGVVKRARQIVEYGRRPDQTSHVTFENLLVLYGHQPRLGTRTSTSVRDQAYSTPVPLAYVASRLAGVTAETTIYEPTAGNGALLIEANPSKVLANEINPGRRANLEEQGFKVTGNDASEMKQAAAGYDVVLANPPFGTVREGEDTKVFDLTDIRPQYMTREIDQAIALRALGNMDNDGRAVLLVGGLNKLVSAPEGRAAGYNSQSKVHFYKTLYDLYNVTDHFTVAGELYERQGAGWPIDVIVIDGRGKSKRDYPARDVPRILTTWDEVGGLLDDVGKRFGERPGDGLAIGEPPGGTAEAAGPGGPGGKPGGDQPAGLGKPPTVGGPVESGEHGGAGVRGRPSTGESGPAAEVQPDERGQSGGTGGKVSPVGRPPGIISVEDLSGIFDEEFQNAFGQRPGEVLAERVESGALGASAPAEAAAEPQLPGPRADTRTIKETAKSAAQNLLDAAAEGDAALRAMFMDPNTLGMGMPFTEENYEKVKPHLIKSAQRFREFAKDAKILLRKLIDHFQNVEKWSAKAVAEFTDFLKRFVVDVYNGVISLGPEPKPAPKSAEKATETQVPYVAASSNKIESLNVLQPVNLREPTERTLARLKEVYGDLADHALDLLGYDTLAELGDAFAAEQVDAIVLGVHNIRQGGALVLGDSGGMGKGRVNAAILRWAMKEGRVPIFVTEKPGLYNDMYRDLTDIGIAKWLGRDVRILPTDNSLSMFLDDEETVKLKSGDKSAHEKLLNELTVDDFESTYDVLFTTYSQMNTVQGGRTTERRTVLQRLMPHAIVVLDESHNGGAAETGRVMKPKPGKAPKRSLYIRELLEKAAGVMYSSATYAKRADSMDLYRATNLAMAVDNINDLADVVSRGGVPMQQAIARMMAEDGQYIRRERSFFGIQWDTPLVAANEQQYEDVSNSMWQINQFSHVVKKLVASIRTGMAGSGDTASLSNATGITGANSLNFTSLMHNIINQMLLALKARPALDLAVEQIKAGEKPVFTVSNTMGAFMNEYADNMDLEPGAKFEGDFRDILLRYLDRTRTITIKKGPGQESEKYYLTDEDLGAEGLAVYNRAKSTINALDLSDIPVSPIDHIKSQLGNLGYKVGEITGRDKYLEYVANGKAILRARPGDEMTARGRVRMIRRFNTRPENGGLHAVIINQSGSTGISMHASHKFDDQSPRHMIIVQPETNIATQMQMLYRIYRTGQVHAPAYTQIVADVPAEKRPAAALQKKMASLNANTTGARSSDLSGKDIPDFLNEYGDRVAAQFATDHPEINALLDHPVHVNDDGRPMVKDAMSHLTGRIPMIPNFQMQNDIYDELGQHYLALLEEMEARGESVLEAKTFLYKGKTKEITEVRPKKNESGSQFAAPVMVEKISIARIGKPYSSIEIGKKLMDEIREGGGLSITDIEVRENKGYYGRASTFSVMGRVSGGELMGDTLDLAREAFKTRAEAEALIAQMRKDGIKALFNPNTSEGAASIIANFEAYDGILGAGAAKKKAALIKETLDAFHTFRDAHLDTLEDAKKPAAKTAFDLQEAAWQRAIDTLDIGRRVELRTAQVGNMIAVTLNFHRDSKARNPLSGWVANFAVADVNKVAKISFNRIYPQGRSPQDDIMAIDVVSRHQELPAKTLEWFDHLQKEVNEDRYFVTGNIVAGFAWAEHKGRIQNFTTAAGDVRTGIKMPEGWNFEAHARKQGRVIADPAELKQWLDDHSYGTAATSDGVVSLTKGGFGDRYFVSTDKGRSVGGLFFLDPELFALTGDFTSKNKRMLATVRDQTKIEAVLKRLMDIGASFHVATGMPQPTIVDDGSAPPDDSGGGQPIFATPEAADEAPDRDEGLAAVAPLPFYSQVERTIQQVKFDRAPAVQWQGFIRNARGIKAEELEWLGLLDWLGQQKGQVAKQTVLDYVQANNTTVSEVESGGGEAVVTVDEQTALMSALETVQRSGEIDIVGINRLLQGAQRGNAVAIGEIEMIGIDDSLIAPFRDRGRAPTKFRSYTLPGSKNYRELLITLPATETQNLKDRRNEINRRLDEVQDEFNRLSGDATKLEQRRALDSEQQRLIAEYNQIPTGIALADYKPPHWDEINVLAHVRFDEREINGERVLHIAEIQSDWHQKGRRQGYAVGKPPDTTGWTAKRISTGGGWVVSDQNGAVVTEVTEPGVYSAKDAIARVGSKPQGVPDAPFKTTWPTLAMKRMIRYASESGYDAITWDTGATQIERYKLSKRIQTLRYYPPSTSYGKGRLVGFKDGNQVLNKPVEQDDLPDEIGKDAADNLLSKPLKQAGGGRPYHYLAGADLDVGGEGMLGFYDNMLPKMVAKLVKPFDGRVGMSSINTPNVDPEKAPVDGYVDRPVHSLRITPQLREVAATEGFPLFQVGEPPGPPDNVIQFQQTPAAHRLRADIEQTMRQEIERMIGPEWARRAEFPDFIPASESNIREGGVLAEGATEALGMTFPAKKIIQVSMSQRFTGLQRNTLYHEVFHAFKERLADDREKALIDRETARMRRILQTQYGYLTDEANSMGDREVQANAAAAYIEDRAAGGTGSGSGLHIGVRGFFERLYRMFLRIGNFVRGLGYQTYEDLLDALYAGEMAERGRPARGAGVRAALDQLRTATAPFPPIAYGKYDGYELLPPRVDAPYGVWRSDRGLELPLTELGVPSADHFANQLFGSLRRTFDDITREIGMLAATKTAAQAPADFNLGSDVRLDMGFPANDVQATELPVGSEPGFLENEERLAEEARQRGEEGSALERARARWGDPGDGLASLGPPPRTPGRGSFTAPTDDWTLPWNRRRLRRDGTKGALTGFVRGGMDSMIDTLNLERAIEEVRGSKLPAGMRPYIAQSLLFTRTAARGEDLKETYLDPILDDLKQSGLENDVFAMPGGPPREGAKAIFDRYLVLMHAGERNVQVARINPQMPDGGSGITTADALNEFRAMSANLGPVKMGILEDNAQRVYAMLRQALRRRLSSGLISQDSYDAMTSTYRRYVPLQGFAESYNFEDDPTLMAGPGMSVRGKEFKRALGRSSEAEEIFAHAVLQATSAIIRSEKNIVGRHMLNLVNNYPHPDLFEAKQGEMSRRINKVTGLVEDYWAPTNKSDPDVLTVKKDGREYTITFHHKGLRNGWKNLGTDEADWVQKELLRPVLRFWTGVRIRWNPEYWLRAFTRDQWDANIAVLAMGHGLGANAYFMKTLPLALKASFDYTLRGVPNPRFAALWDEFRLGGGKLTWYKSGREVDELAREMQRHMSEGNTKKAMAAVPRFMEKVNETFETATRLAVYATAKRYGHSPFEAASIALESTVNFSRRGTKSALIRSLYPFFGANVNANLKFARQLRMASMGVKHSAKAVRLAVLGMFWMGFLTALMSRWAGGDDDDGVALWDKIPPHEKDANLIFMWGTTENDRSKLGIFPELKIPMRLGELAADKMFGKGMSWAKAAGDFGQTVINALPLIGQSHMGMPAVADPTFSLVANRDAFGRPIHPTPHPDSVKANLPKSQVQFSWTAPGWKSMAEFIGWAGGGSEIEKPVAWLDLHPEDVRFLTHQALGGAWNFFSSATELGVRLGTGTQWSDVDIREIPIARGFHAKGTDFYTNTEFNKARKQALEAFSGAEKARELDLPDTPKIEQMQEQGSDGRRIILRTREQMQPLNLEAAEVRADPNLSMAERERRIKDINRQRLEIRKEALQEFREIGLGHGAKPYQPTPASR